MSNPTDTARKLLKAIDGIHVGLQVQPGVVIRSADVIRVCEALIEAEKREAKR